MNTTKDAKNAPSTPKERKVTSGLLRDKARTKARMVASVGKVIQKKGYAGLNLTNVATECGVDVKLIRNYFGNLDNLVEEYISQRDFWKHVAKDNINSMVSSPGIIGSEEITDLLQNQFNTLLKDKILQSIIHWELGEQNKLLRKIADQREMIGEKLFSKIEPSFKNAGVNIRAVLAILIGGVYYLSLHGKNNGSLFCGIDINTTNGEKQIDDAIRYLVFCAYEHTDNPI